MIALAKVYASKANVFASLDTVVTIASALTLAPMIVLAMGFVSLALTKTVAVCAHLDGLA